jgi:peptide/nickel transport system ATP-binding protein
MTVAGELAGTGSQTARDDVVLRAEHVSVEYAGTTPVRAVRDVSLDLRRGEILGIAGESGSGKSTLAYALTRLLRPPATLTQGTIQFRGKDGETVDLMALDPVSLRRFRWTKVSMVFQSAMNALNPVTSLRTQFADIFRAHAPEMDADARERRSRELLEMVGIDPKRLHGYPHELSGGMRQRVNIAMALALQPEIVVMDEPTTALDVVVQRDILDEIERLREEFGFSIIFITHDLSLLLELSDRLAVMYAGEIVEYGPAERMGRTPAHPYTSGLLHSFPELLGERQSLRGVPGSPPDLRAPLPGCAFRPRCQFAFQPCAATHPVLGPPDRALVAARPDERQEPRAGWQVACHLHDRELNPEGLPRLPTAGPAQPEAGPGSASGQTVTNRPPAEENA